MRVTALLTNTPAGVVPFQAAGLELRHRQQAPVEDQLRLRIDKTWRWAAQIAEGFDRLRAAFA